MGRKRKISDLDFVEGAKKLSRADENPGSPIYNHSPTDLGWRDESDAIDGTQCIANGFLAIRIMQ